MIVVVVVVAVVVVWVIVVEVVVGTVYVGGGSVTHVQVTGSQNIPGIVLLQLKSAHT